MLPESVWGPPLAAALWWWRLAAFEPALRARRLGSYRPMTLGAPLSANRTEGRGPLLSRRLSGPGLLQNRPEHYASVDQFDEVSDRYETVVRPFSDPIVAEARRLLEPHLGPRARLLDPSAGPASTAIEIARDLPQGEVVAADLSRGMVLHGFERMQQAGLTNMAFVQADVSTPPPAFNGYFDAVFCCLAFHHYPDGDGAVRA